MLWLWSGQPESYCWVSFASAFQLFLAVESSSLFHLCIRLIFIFSEMLHWWVRNPFTRTEEMSCVYHGRTKGEGCGHVNRFKLPPPPSNIYWPFRRWFIILPLGLLGPLWLFSEIEYRLGRHYRPYAASQTTVLHMKRLNQTESPIFVILCCFQRQSFLTFILLYYSWCCAVWQP